MNYKLKTVLEKISDNKNLITNNDILPENPITTIEKNNLQKLYDKLVTELKDSENEMINLKNYIKRKNSYIISGRYKQHQWLKRRPIIK